MIFYSVIIYSCTLSKYRSVTIGVSGVKNDEGNGTNNYLADLIIQNFAAVFI